MHSLNTSCLAEICCGIYGVSLTIVLHNVCTTSLTMMWHCSRMTDTETAHSLRRVRMVFACMDAVSNALRSCNCRMSLHSAGTKRCTLEMSDMRSDM